jgi:hypothetical protein
MPVAPAGPVHTRGPARSMIRRLTAHGGRLITRTTTLAATAMIAIGLGAAPSAAEAGKSPGPKMQRHLDQVKDATKRYKEVEMALRDGYLASDHCEAKPGVGAMGYHYTNPELLGDRRIRPLHPEQLLYVPTPSGGRRLGGVEYSRADADQDLSTDLDRPDFYGRRFNGPMAGHFPGQPIHYDLHVWLFQDNPDGVFARYNREASC